MPQGFKNIILQWTLPAPCHFTKNLSSRERLKPWFCVTFNHNSHLSWKFHCHSSSRSEDNEDVIRQYLLFSKIFRIFRHFLVTKKHREKVKKKFSLRKISLLPPSECFPPTKMSPDKHIDLYADFCKHIYI